MAEKFSYWSETNWGTDRIGFFRDYEKQYAAFNAKARKAEVEVIEPGHEVPPETVLKITKTGKWNTQSTMGKLVTMIEAGGGVYKIGKSVYRKESELHDHIWLEGVVDRKHVLQVGSDVWVNKKLMGAKDAFKILEE